MSRIGSIPINIPDGISVTNINSTLSIKSIQSYQEIDLIRGLICEIVDNKILLSIDQTKKENYNKLKPIWGTYRSNIYNIIAGMVSSFSVALEINGVGYKAERNNSYLILSLGYSHSIFYKIPQGIEMTCIKSTHLLVSGINKQKVFMIASDICKLRKYDPYKGKGIIIKGRVMLHKIVSKKK
ncbi:50S ribosomal protein L6 [Wolbachia endosymbiont of Howardula sp.]|uniref:50S ribosomal protein L6 n=1 Tax=Wolbachia endosymbiont of Howardula sp. TaxID=2916816 RepID=UPI00217D4222|nr:50S ribosomal protein L6 [Wolbachia endosymbiont of Howardula sp.]UWI83156.1 50S ribosomal protein L6 [Wolbachia endosymbiont of Howardula sp.]